MSDDYCLNPNQCGIGQDCSPCYQVRIKDLKAERDELRARVAELEDVISGIEVYSSDTLSGRMSANGESQVRWLLKGFLEVVERCRTALSRTPAQSRAEIEAGALERFADDMEKVVTDAAGSKYELGCMAIIIAARERSARIRAGGEG